MPANFAPGQWGVILGGSSGFGLATARVLADHGLNLCIVHRDRRSQLTRIESEFEKLRGSGVELRTFNTDALAVAKRNAILDALMDLLTKVECGCCCTRSHSATSSSSLRSPKESHAMRPTSWPHHSV